MCVYSEPVVQLIWVKLPKKFHFIFSGLGLFYYCKFRIFTCKVWDIFISAWPYICLSFKSSLSRSSWVSGPLLACPPDAHSFILYSVILSMKSFCTRSRSSLNATAVIPMCLFNKLRLQTEWEQRNWKVWEESWPFCYLNSVWSSHSFHWGQILLIALALNFYGPQFPSVR